jgi:hypothetical protein
MAIMVVTRLRLKNPDVLNDFFAAAVAALEQARKSDGTCYQHIVADGQSAALTQPSAAQHDRSFPPPVVPDHAAGGS